MLENLIHSMTNVMEIKSLKEEDKQKEYNQSESDNFRL